MKEQKQIQWWQPVITLLGIVGCVVLVGMTAFDPAPACNGGECMPMAYYQHGSSTSGPPPKTICGDGVCEEGESTYNCAIDCGNWCGDGICAAEEVDTCCGPGTDCTVEITCGDGICSACESYELCYEDCDLPTPIPTDTPEPTPTETEVPTLPPSASRRTPTPRPTKEEAEPTPTPTDTPSPTPEIPACEVIDPGALASNLQASFANQISDEFPPIYLTCEELPDELCLSLDSSVDVETAFEQIIGRTIVNPGTDLDLTLDDVSDLRLNYCTSGGQCIAYMVKSFDRDEGLICFGMVGQAVQPNCKDGCIFALANEQKLGQLPADESEPVINEMVDGQQQTESPVIGAIVVPVLGGVLGLAILALFVLLFLLSRRQKEEVEEDDDDEDVYRHT
jgi:hypothetical protein